MRTWGDLFHTALGLLNVLAIHMPTAAIFNYFLWGYILPLQLRSKMEKSYA